MKQLMKGIFFLTILFTPVFCPSLLSYAQSDPQTEDMVYSLDELSAWWNSHLETGGQVYLGDNIIISSDISIISTDSEMVIDTGKYGLIFDGYCLLGDNLMIIGEGVETPVVDVYDVGGWSASWNNGIQDMQITAYGRDGKGGTAVRISQDDPDPATPANMRYEGSIQSYGEGAIGVYLAVPLDVYCLNVSVEGAESTAIYSAQEANLYYCKLNAQGNGATSVTGNGEITLNACAANPQANNFTSNDYSIVDTVGRSLYYPVKLNSEIAGYFNYAYTFLLSSSDAQLSYYETLRVTWLPDPNDINKQTLGSTVLSGSLKPPFQELGLESQFPLELVVDVRDPAIPCISELRFSEKVSSEKVSSVYAILSFWDTYDPNDENVILWRSDDNGQTWYDFTDSPDLEWAGYDLYYYYGEITGTIMLQLEVIGVGESNVATLRSTDQAVGGGIGGDRTGTDRVVKGGNSPDPEMEPNLGADNPTDTNSPDNNSDTKEETIPTPNISSEKAENTTDTNSKLSELPSPISEFQLGGFYVTVIANNEILPASDTTTEQSEVLQLRESTEASIENSVASAEDLVASAGDSIASAEDLVASAGDSMASAGDSMASAGDSMASAEDLVTSAEDSLASTGESAGVSGNAILRSQTDMFLLLGIKLSAACTAIFFGLYLWNKQKKCKR